MFNHKNTLPGSNWAAFYRLTYYKRYIQQGLRYQMQLTLAETNCTSERQWSTSVCTLVPNTALIRFEIGIQSIPWANSLKVTHSHWTSHNCTKPVIIDRTKNRNCNHPRPPIPVHPLTNVSHCVNFIAIGGFFTSSCNDNIVNIHSESRDLALPEQVYLVCGNLAHGCVPVWRDRGQSQTVSYG